MATAPITSTPVPPAQQKAASATDVASSTLAGNFTSFLTLLTTQLKNQNPLEPLDTNQFTQQLVQFAQVEQQLKSNQELSSLVAMQQTAQATQALAFVGTTVAVDGASTQLQNGVASWSVNLDQAADTTLTITNATGQTVYTGTFAAQSGIQHFGWDGRGNDGAQWPDGVYKMTVTAKNASGSSVAVSTEVYGVVDGVDLTARPPLLSVGGQNYTVDKVKRVTIPAAPPPASSGVNLSL